MDEYAREPCPWRIIDDCGGAFSMGLIGGSIFQMINGARNAPKGFSRRLMGGIVRVKERAPIFGGQFAAWGICFSTFDCTFVHLRQKVRLSISMEVCRYELTNTNKVYNAEIML